MDTFDALLSEFGHAAAEHDTAKVIQTREALMKWAMRSKEELRRMTLVCTDYSEAFKAADARVDVLEKVGNQRFLLQVQELLEAIKLQGTTDFDHWTKPLRDFIDKMSRP